MESQSTREATHAGSWYSKNKNELDKQLVSWLDNAKFDIKNIKTVKAIIAPQRYYQHYKSSHAGYAYSGSTAAWAYKYLKFTNQDPIRVFLLGPCHHVYIRGCGLTSLKNYDTPLGGLEIDHETLEKLKTEAKWIMTDKETEEEEHSLELHLPYIRKIFEGRKVKLVPIMVGAIDRKLEETYGTILAKYFDEENTVFCISSDFCHWGKRFQYTKYDKEDGEIHHSIEKLDKKGMKLIEDHNPEQKIDTFQSPREFADYLDETENTICGRHPISVLLNLKLKIISKSKYQEELITRFVRYAQSEPVKNTSQSSVSYASSVTYIYADEKQ